MNPGPAPEEVRAEVQRILQSQLFSNCERLRRFISFAAQHALSGSGQLLKEYVIGIEVFDRTTQFDPRIDPIVRVEARRLRSKLTSYYASMGYQDPVEVVFPKGTYQPVFRHRTARRPIAPDVTITVAPFGSLTMNGDDGFAKGLTEEIVHGLANAQKMQKMRVLPWNGDPSNQPVAGFARAKTDVLLRGSVRCRSTGVRVISQLIDVGSQVYLWSEAFDREGLNFAEAQDSIARAIIDSVQTILP